LFLLINRPLPASIPQNFVALGFNEVSPSIPSDRKGLFAKFGTNLDPGKEAYRIISLNFCL
jgi:hypothetical protein